ncbi:stage III sporulation protein AH [Clostridium brassicae]|uniref:Stage III sporulation protein AH n=1 Tax=Clostridium brassicae TaxID=2999072 RepID=A0ABT4DB35_9CLOT|nr:stage III sporulation protein AH [Clostridium brassicae]MCY6959518.1 stage III sporulation protein AH [Clostridium brassicae]
MFIQTNPKNKAYYNLLDIAFDVCDTFILVIRKDMDCNQSVFNIINMLQDSLIEMKEESEWVGTELLGQTAYVYYYKTNDNAKKIIKSISNSLYEWTQPNFPEDLSFIKNGEAWLINTAHEYEGYLLTEDPILINRLKSIDGLNLVE